MMCLQYFSPANSDYLTVSLVVKRKDNAAPRPDYSQGNKTDAHLDFCVNLLKHSGSVPVGDKTKNDQKNRYYGENDRAKTPDIFHQNYHKNLPRLKGFLTVIITRHVAHVTRLLFEDDLCAYGRTTPSPLCSGCLDRLHIQLCRGIGQPRSVALLDAVRGRLGHFLPKLTGGASRSAGLFGGPVVSTIRVFLSSFVAERNGAQEWMEIVAEQRTENFAEVAA